MRRYMYKGTLFERPFHSAPIEENTLPTFEPRECLVNATRNDGWRGSSKRYMSHFENLADVQARWWGFRRTICRY